MESDSIMVMALNDEEEKEVVGNEEAEGESVCSIGCGNGGNDWRRRVAKCM